MSFGNVTPIEGTLLPGPLGGNRCGHDPRNPRLVPAYPIRKGKGGLPRILSLAGSCEQTHLAENVTSYNKIMKFNKVGQKGAAVYGL